VVWLINQRYESSLITIEVELIQRLGHVVMGNWCRITRRLRIVKQLRSPGDVLLFLRIFFFATAVPALLRLKMSTLQSMLEPRHAPLMRTPARIQKTVSYVDWALQLGRPLIRSGCLTRGLTLYYFLRRVGLDVTLCFGATKAEDRIDAHCWLVKDGKPFLETKDPRLLFVKVYSLPQESRSPVPLANTSGVETKSR